MGAFYLAFITGCMFLLKTASQTLQNYAMKFTPPGGCPSSQNGVLNIGITIPVPAGAVGVQIKQVSFVMYGSALPLPSKFTLSGGGASASLMSTSVVQCCNPNCDLAVYAGSWYNSPCGKPSGCGQTTQWYTLDFSGTSVGSCSTCGMKGTSSIGLNFDFNGSPFQIGNYGSGTTAYVSYYALPGLSVTPSATVTPTPSPTVTPTPGPANLIPNGDFENGWTNFYSVYNYIPENQLKKYRDAGVFTGPTTWYTCQGIVDHTTGTGKFFGADGGSDPNDIVWQANGLTTVVAGNTYRFQAWVTTLWTITPTSPGPQLNFNININNNGWKFLGTHPTLPDGCFGWIYIYADYTPIVSGDFTLQLVDSSTAALGNDFAIDDIYFGLLSQAPYASQLTPSIAPSVSVYPSVYPSSTSFAIPSSQPKRINIIPNGDFEEGWTGFTTVYTRGNIASRAGMANIYKGPINIWNMCNAYDHTFGNGYFLGENGASNPTDIAWQVDGLEPLVAGNTYRFQAWITTLTTIGGGSPGPILSFYISEGGGAWNFLGTHVPLPNGCPGWTYIYADYLAINSVSFQIKFVNTQTASSGNDYALDDIYFGLLSEAPYAMQPSMTATSSASSAFSATALQAPSDNSIRSDRRTPSWNRVSTLTSNPSNSFLVSITAALSDSSSTSMSASSSVSVSAEMSVSSILSFSAMATATKSNPSNNPTPTALQAPSDNSIRSNRRTPSRNPVSTLTSNPSNSFLVISMTVESSSSSSASMSASSSDSLTAATSVSFVPSNSAAQIKSKRQGRSQYKTFSYYSTITSTSSASASDSSSVSSSLSNSSSVSLSPSSSSSSSSSLSLSPSSSSSSSLSSSESSSAPVSAFLNEIIFYSFNNSMSRSATPSFFPMMMTTTFVNETALIALSETLLVEDSKGTILGATGIGIGGVVLLVMLARYCGIFGGAKDDKEAKKYVESKCTSLKAFGLTLLKNRTKLMQLIKNPKEAFAELKDVVMNEKSTSVSTTVSDTTSATTSDTTSATTSDTTSATTSDTTSVTEEQEVTVIEQMETGTVIHSPQMVLPPKVVKKIVTTTKKPNVHIPSSNELHVGAPKPTPVKLTQKIVVNKEVVTPGYIVNYRTKKMDSSIYDDTLSTENNTPQLNMQTIVPENVEVQIVENIVIREEETLVQNEETHQNEETQQQEETQQEETQQEEIQQEETQQEETQQEETQQDEVPGVILPSDQVESEKIKIEFDKEHLAEIMTVLNAMKKQYDVLK